MSSHKDNVTSSEHLLGRVKWFNNKAGYGFITVTDGTRSGTDIFVHHSSVNVENQQYKYLVQGEYVEFDLIRVETDKHEWQASCVSGIKGGKLMCETRNDLKLARNEYNTYKSGEQVAQPKMPRQKSVSSESRPVPRKTLAPRVRGEGPRDGNKKEWTLVGKENHNGKTRVPKTAQGSTIITIQSK